MGDLFSGIGFLFEQAFTRPIFNVLLLLYHLFGDFGLSIVVLTLIVKLVLFPLTLQQLKSTKANQALQPQLQEIRRKYAKDQRALIEATQALYKEYGINPMAGCLPLLIQLPVLYGLYFAFMAVLHNSANLTQEINVGLKYPFIPPFENFNVDLTWFTWLQFLQPAWPWVISLAQPDPTHTLPIVAALTTFIQIRMSLPKTLTSNANAKAGQDPTTSAMKMMQYMMPFFTLFISWNLASGLALYWTVSSIFQAVQQYFVTGWGSLLAVPEFLSPKGGSSSEKSASSNGASSSRKNNTKEHFPAEEVNSKFATTTSSGVITEKMRTTTGGRSGSGGSSTQSTARRSRNTSASARRRSGTQKPRR